jgi:outer membrane protein assembly factor BamA
MIPFRASLIGLPVVAALSLPVSAQVNHATYYPKQILYKGAPEYRPADLNAIVQLQPNKGYTTQDVEPAVERLGDTGLFADIRFTIDNLTLTFTLTPQPDNVMLRAVYSNFVMFAPGELTPLVHAKVPLYTGRIPAAGNLQQTVEDALTAILHEKGIPNGTVTSVNAGITASTVAFSITNPPVQIHAVHVDNVSPAAQPKIAEIQQAFVGNDYETGSEDAVRTRLLNAFHDLAFLDAEVAPPVASAPDLQPGHILVDLSTSATEGGQYRLAKLNLPQTDIVPQADLLRAADLKPGDLATRIGLLATTSHIDRQFTRHGYMNAKITPAEVKDASTHTVVYTLSVDPGQLFHLGILRVLNLNDQQLADFKANWTLANGAVYDENYVMTCSPPTPPSAPSKAPPPPTSKRPTPTPAWST